MSTNRVDSNPAWTAPARQFVPLHLQPGSTRSSFARPDSYNLHSPKPLAAPSTASASSPPKSRAQRSGFASKPKSKSKRTGTLDTDDELPPTLSIRVMGGQDIDSQDFSTPGFNVPASAAAAAAAASTSNGSNGPVSRGTPVIVFGFPPGATQSVLHYFGKIGEITENVASSESQGPAAAAIECGRNWLRITYRDREAAQRALAQNGHLMPGQYVIGCVPAEPGEYTSTMQQSSTNSLLLDDSEVSLIQEQSMASVLESGDQTDEQAASMGQDSIKPSVQNESQSQPVLPQSQHQQQQQQQILPDKIVPREMSSQLFREQAPSTNKTQVHMSEINSTKLPEKSAPTSLVGKFTNAVSQAFLNWDV